MHLSKSDIFQAAVVGLSLVVSALAVPVIASGQKSLSVEQPTQHSQQVIQQNSD